MHFDVNLTPKWKLTTMIWRGGETHFETEVTETRKCSRCLWKSSERPPKSSYHSLWDMVGNENPGNSAIDISRLFLVQMLADTYTGPHSEENPYHMLLICCVIDAFTGLSLLGLWNSFFGARYLEIMSLRTLRFGKLSLTWNTQLLIERLFRPP